MFLADLVFFSKMTFYIQCLYRRLCLIIAFPFIKLEICKPFKQYTLKTILYLPSADESLKYGDTEEITFLLVCHCGRTYRLWLRNIYNPSIGETNWNSWQESSICALKDIRLIHLLAYCYNACTQVTFLWRFIFVVLSSSYCMRVYRIRALIFWV